MSAHDETKAKLHAAWRIVKANESTESLYKSMYESTEIYYKMYKKWYEEEKQRADEWKEKYEKLESAAPARSSVDFTDKSADRILSKYIEILSRVNDLAENSRKGIEAEEAGANKAPALPKATGVRLICIIHGPLEFRHKDGSVELLEPQNLEELGRYTSPGLIDDEKWGPCYPINELGGEPKLAERFYVCQDQPKQKRGRKKKD